MVGVLTGVGVSLPGAVFEPSEDWVSCEDSDSGIGATVGKDLSLTFRVGSGLGTETRPRDLEFV